MQLTFLGTGVVVPTKDRAQSGILVTRPFPILFDCGSGVLRRIEQAGYRHIDINTIFFTHHHLDHDIDFIALVKANWLRGEKKMKVYGPIGTKEWIENLIKVYPYMKDRVNFEIIELKDKSRVNIESIEVEAREVIHSVPTLGYRIEGDSTLVISGDTEPCKGVKELCKKGVELLIHECSFPDSYDVTNHTIPHELGRLIKDLNIKKVILTHLYPETKGHENEMIKSIRKNFNGEVLIAYDLLGIKF